MLARLGWWCYLCAEPISGRLHYLHPDALTIDHIVPVALGGSDELDNLQPAHRRCNVAKGTSVQTDRARKIARIAELRHQLALIAEQPYTGNEQRGCWWPA